VHKIVSKPHLTANNLLIWPVLGALRYSGADVPTVLAQVGMDAKIAFAPNARVPLEQLFAIWRAAVDVTRDPALGVHLSKITVTDPLSTVSWPMPLSLFEHMGMFCSTPVESVKVCNRYLRLLRDGVHIDVEIDGKRAVFRIDLLTEQPTAMADYDCAIIVNTARRVLKRELAVDEVWFTRETPADVTPYEAHFRAPLRFGAPFNAMICRAEELARPLPTANAIIRAHLERQAQSLLAELPAIDVFEDKVSAQIRSELPSGNTNASVIAEKLGVSARTLHRRLQQEGTSYQDLLDNVRLRLSIGYLESGKSISQVALLVGFAQASTFHRAFKSWTGETPADYQMRTRSRPGERLDPDPSKLAGPTRRAG
jgi:AraC-like DNA-binding protein